MSAAENNFFDEESTGEPPAWATADTGTPEPSGVPRTVNGEAVAPEYTDDSIGQIFSFRFRRALRYVAKWGQWMVYRDGVWRSDDTLYVRDLVRKACRLAACETTNVALQTKLASNRTVGAVEALIRSDRIHATSVEDWDADAWLLNTPAGVTDLRTGDVTPHSGDNLMTKQTAVSPGGECPMWEAFLRRATAGDDELMAYLQRVAGYCLTGSIREQKLFFAYGTGGNGKGTFLNTIMKIMGNYAMEASPETFYVSNAPRHLTELARLQGARLVVAQENEAGKQLAEARVKSITGGDRITANYMRQDPFTYMPQFKLCMSGNFKPVLRNVDAAIKRRFRLIPFEVSIPTEEQDGELPDKLQAEWPGILQWMIDGCLAWQDDGLPSPNAVQLATEDYFATEDNIMTWVQDCCVTTEGHAEDVSALFKSWTVWSKDSGEPAGSKKRFAQALDARGFARKRGTAGVRQFVGLELKVERAANDPARWEQDDIPY